MFFIAYTFKGHVPVFAGPVKIEIVLFPVLDYDPEGSPTKI